MENRRTVHRALIPPSSLYSAQSLSPPSICDLATLPSLSTAFQHVWPPLPTVKPDGTLGRKKHALLLDWEFPEAGPALLLFEVPPSSPTEPRLQQVPGTQTCGTDVQTDVSEELAPLSCCPVHVVSCKDIVSETVAQRSKFRLPRSPSARNGSEV